MRPSDEKVSRLGLGKKEETKKQQNEFEARVDARMKQAAAYKDAVSPEVFARMIEAASLGILVFRNRTRKIYRKEKQRSRTLGRGRDDFQCQTSIS
jgi:hypothetical protein